MATYVEAAMTRPGETGEAGEQNCDTKNGRLGVHLVKMSGSICLHLFCFFSIFFFFCILLAAYESNLKRRRFAEKFSF